MSYSIDEVRCVTSECTIYAKIKPWFFNSLNNILNRSTVLFQRLSVDYKGPISISSSGCRYILTVIDEYSRIHFAFSRRDCSSQTAILCLMTIFSIFGLPSFIHSDRGTLFMSEEFKQFLLWLGIGSSNTTAYNPRVNSQCERYNGIIWNTILLALESQWLPVNAWQDVLQDVLHFICSLLCTTTNATPHERVFNFERHSSTGTALPVWLCEPGEVLLKQLNHEIHSYPKSEMYPDSSAVVSSFPTGLAGFANRSSGGECFDFHKRKKSCGSCPRDFPICMRSFHLYIYIYIWPLAMFGCCCEVLLNKALIRSFFFITLQYIHIYIYIYIYIYSVCVCVCVCVCVYIYIYIYK